MLALRTHNIRIFGGMNGKLASENFFESESHAEGENDEMGVPNYRYRN